MHTLFLHKRRTLVAWLGSALALSACAMGPRENTANLSAEDKILREKFRGISGGVLRVDAVGYPKEYVSITTETGASLDGSGLLTLRNAMTAAFGGGPTIVPKSVRATWKKNNPPITSSGGGNWVGGTIIGDYTVPVAQRIPVEVLDDVRKNGGALRLKIRLHDEGIYIGWDIEYSLGSLNGYRMAGGDFKEVRPAYVVFEDGKKIAVPSSMATPLSASDEAFLRRHNLMLVGVQGGIVTNPPTPANHRRVWEKAWYIDKSGTKIFTDELPGAKNYDITRPPQPFNGVQSPW